MVVVGAAPASAYGISAPAPAAVAALVAVSPSTPTLSVNATGTSTSIAVSWLPVPGAVSYRLYSDRNKDTALPSPTPVAPELSFAGTGTKTTITNLLPGGIYFLELQALDASGRFIARSITRAGTQLPEIFSWAGASYTLNSNQTKVQWGSAPGVTSYTITRDGQPLGSTPKPYYVSAGTQVSRHEYTISATGVDPSDTSKTQDYSWVVSVPATPPALSAPNLESSQNREARTVADGGTALASFIPSNKFTNETKMAWRAFIPDKYVPAPVNCAVAFPGKMYYSGNDRGFATSSNADSKTRADVTFVWQNRTDPRGPATIDVYKKPGTTRLYEKVGESYILRKTKTASADGIKVSTFPPTYSSGIVRIELNSTIPICDTIAPAISGNLLINVSRDGLYFVAGEHDKAPSHEITRVDYNASVWGGPVTSSQVHCVYNFTNQGFRNLFPLFPNQKIQFEGTVPGSPCVKS